MTDVENMDSAETLKVYCEMFRRGSNVISLPK